MALIVSYMYACSDAISDLFYSRTLMKVREELS